MSRGRPEIYLLRGAAVLAVLAYHLWPGRLPGGFTGLDVFFVISGYLITGILLGMRERDGRIALGAFFARRARRILPAAIVVLLACLAGMFAFVSITDWGRTAGEVFASSLFAENWVLIASGSVYAGPDTATAVQHYWTLGVEVQFYVLWALLMGALLRGARRERTATIGMGAVFVLSLVASIVWCIVAPDSGYLSTATRLWELAAGGLVAALVRRVPPLRIGVPLAGVGWVLVLGSFALATLDLPWPGALALIPVAGTALVIAAGVPADAPRLRRLTDNPVTRTLADSSYAIYLWHWPLIVFADRALGHPPTTLDKLGIAVASLLLGWLTTVLVERPIRFGLLARSRPVATLALGVLAVAAVAIPSIAVRQTMLRTTELYEAIGPAPATGLCVGAEARMPGADCVDGPYTSLTPDPLGPWEQVSVLHDMGCATDNVSAAVEACDFGDPEGAVHVALVGDSHAMKVWPALKAIADQQGWRLTVYAKANCEFAGPAQTTADGCRGWATAVAHDLQTAGPWNLVVTTGASHATGVPGSADAYRAAWQPVIDAGAQLVDIRDNAYLRTDIRQCIVDHLDDPSACDQPRVQSFNPDVWAETALTMPGASVIDLSDLMCDASTCFAVLGGVITHRDGDHVTDAFALSYAPYLAAQLARIAPALFAR